MELLPSQVLFELKQNSRLQEKFRTSLASRTNSNKTFIKSWVVLFSYENTKFFAYKPIFGVFA